MIKLNDNGKTYMYFDENGFLRQRDGLNYSEALYFTCFAWICSKLNNDTELTEKLKQRIYACIGERTIYRNEHDDPWWTSRDTVIVLLFSLLIMGETDKYNEVIERWKFGKWGHKPYMISIRHRWTLGTYFWMRKWYKSAKLLMLIPALSAWPICKIANLFGKEGYPAYSLFLTGLMLYVMPNVRFIANKYMKVIDKDSYFLKYLLTKNRLWLNVGNENYESYNDFRPMRSLRHSKHIRLLRPEEKTANNIDYLVFPTFLTMIA